MEVIEFEAALVERTGDGAILIALFDGSLSTGQRPACVGLFRCASQAAEALWNSLGSALKHAISEDRTSDEP